MNRKRLPKVIVPTTDDRHATSVGTASELREASAPVEVQPVPEPDVMSPAPRLSAPTVLDFPTGSARRDDPLRRGRAIRIVNRHACYSALGGIVPLPLVNFASVTGVIVRMVKALSVHYQVPFERDRARAIVVGLAAGVMPSGAAAVASSSLFYIVPGSALVGLAVSSASAAACTRSIGRIFIEHFENGAALVDHSEE
jgi:uncharacterized protein (DUF697 family)